MGPADVKIQGKEGGNGSPLFLLGPGGLCSESGYLVMALFCTELLGFRATSDVRASLPWAGGEANTFWVTPSWTTGGASRSTRASGQSRCHLLCCDLHQSHKLRHGKGF